MRIIKVSNLDKETVSDIVIAEKVHNYYVKFITTELNRAWSGDSSPDFFRVVEDDYKLHVFEP